MSYGITEESNCEHEYDVDSKEVCVCVRVCVCVCAGTSANIGRPQGGHIIGAVAGFPLCGDVILGPYLATVGSAAS